MASVSNHAWAPGPLHPRLDDRSVHVWRVDLSAVTEDLAALLCRDEHARAERFIGARHRELWMRARGVLRALIGRYLDCDPRALSFASGPSGKPSVAASGLSFNLSHSGQLALYAFASANAVGVDVEVARRPFAAVALAGRVFGPAEARRLDRLDPAIRQREFLRMWTRHEAALKCSGTGIGAPAPLAGSCKQWIADLDVGDGAAGAVAADRTPHELRCSGWSD